MNRTVMTAMGALMLAAATQAVAFEPLPDGTTTEERANTARLNAEQLAKAQAETSAYEQSVAAAAQQKASAEATFEQQTAAYEAEKARIATLSAEERAKWEADVAACDAGDKTRCAAPVTPPKH